MGTNVLYLRYEDQLIARIDVDALLQPCLHQHVLQKTTASIDLVVVNNCNHYGVNKEYRQARSFRILNGITSMSIDNLQNGCRHMDFAAGTINLDLRQDFSMVAGSLLLRGFVPTPASSGTMVNV